MFSGERTGVHRHSCMCFRVIVFQICAYTHVNSGADKTSVERAHEHHTSARLLKTAINPKPCTSTALQDGNSEVARKYILDALQGASHLPSLMDEYAPPRRH
jgi:hypothetical protein